MSLLAATANRDNLWTRVPTWGEDTMHCDASLAKILSSKRVLITTPKESRSTALIFFVPPTVACVHQQLRNWRHGWGLQVAVNPLVAVLTLAKWGWKSVCPRNGPRHARAQHTAYVDKQWRSSITRFGHFAVELHIFALFQLLLSGNGWLFKSANFGPFDPCRLGWDKQVNDEI